MSLLLLLSVVLSTSSPLSGLTGSWGGWVEMGGREFWFQVRVAGEDVLLDDFNGSPRGVPARDLHREEDRVSFLYDAPAGEITFSGEIEGRRWIGNAVLEGDGRPGRFVFMRFHELSDEELDKWTGRFRDSETGRLVWVVPRSFGGLRLVERVGEGGRFADYDMDAWLPFDDGRFINSEEIDKSFPEKLLVRDGEDLFVDHSEGRVLERSEGSVLRATIPAGEKTLHGWLAMPSDARAAIAYAHGSGYVAADHPFDLYTTYRLVEEVGFAVLRWDKAGVWRSGGDQGKASYHDLADDIEAAHSWLVTQLDDQATQVGIGGLSQAPSWPIPLVAARAEDVAFVLATSGSTTTIAETNAFNWSNRLRRRGYSDEQVQEARSFILTTLRLGAENFSPELQARVDRHLATFEQEAWFDAACELGGLKTPLDAPVLDRWRQICHLDPIASWREVQCPVFQAWGADDPLVDAEESLRRIDAMIAETGQRNFRTILYPSPAAHGVGSANTPSFFEDVLRWFKTEVDSDSSR